MKKIIFEKLTVKETIAIRAGDDTSVSIGMCDITPSEDLPKGTDCVTTPLNLITAEEDCNMPAVPEMECAGK